MVAVSLKPKLDRYRRTCEIEQISYYWKLLLPQAIYYPLEALPARSLGFGLGSAPCRTLLPLGGRRRHRVHVP